MDIDFFSFLTWLVFAEAEFNFFNKMAHTSYESPTQSELYIACLCFQKTVLNNQIHRFDKDIFCHEDVSPVSAICRYSAYKNEVVTVIWPHYQYKAKAITVCGKL